MLKRILKTLALSLLLLGMALPARAVSQKEMVAGIFPSSIYPAPLLA